ncbi:DNA ligase 1-like [Trematomus bernacchii]|uniref:DNA ligase 1-like n=1 Tax=Trematomus bernacchii TaxID=40690 RepID=UPI00146A58AE|nr:DNA ligase 1-like [Trematomus bernacchii]
MAALRKANQELKQLKEPCVEEQDVEMEMNNRDVLAVWLEILEKENQEMELLLEQERTPLRDKLEIEGAKKKEAMLKAYTAALQFQHNVKVKAQEEVEAEMAALRKANQELKQLKEPCVEEQDVEMEMNNRDELAVWLEILQKENQEMELLLEQERTPLRDKLEIEGAKKTEAMLKAYTAALQFQHNVKVKAQEEVEAEMAALRKANQELKQLKEPCVEEQDVEMEMNNRDVLAVWLEILQKENQEMELLLEQERTPLRDKLEIEGAKKKEAMLKAYTAALQFQHNVKVKAQEEVEAEMAALRKANQELKQLKEPCVEEQGVEMAALRETNQELQQQKQRCVEEKDKEIAALLKTNQEVKQQKERCLEEKSVEIAALRERNQELTQLKERCVKEEAKMAALQTTNQELKQQKLRCVEEKDAEIAALLKENQTLKQEKERCVDAEIVALLKKQLNKPPQALSVVKEELVEVKVELEVEQEVRVDPPEQTNEPIPTTQRRTTPWWRRFINSFSCIRPNINDD